MKHQADDGTGVPLKIRSDGGRRRHAAARSYEDPPCRKHMRDCGGKIILAGNGTIYRE